MTAKKIVTKKLVAKPIPGEAAAKKNASVKQEEIAGMPGLEKVLVLAEEGILLARDIAKDGVNMADLDEIPEVFDYVKSVIEFVGTKPNLVTEIKSINFMSGMQLAQKVKDLYTKVSA